MLLVDLAVLCFKFEENATHSHRINSEVDRFTPELLNDVHVDIFFSAASILILSSSTMLLMAASTPLTIVLLGVHHSATLANLDVTIFISIATDYRYY